MEEESGTPRERKTDTRILVTTGHNGKVGRSTKAEWVDDVTDGVLQVESTNHQD
jgi:hypothetical protein